MTDLLPVAWPAMLGALLITTGSATLQGTIGFGFSITCVPTLALLDPRLAPVPQMLVVTPLVFRMAWRERHAIDVKGALWILVGRFPGAALGVALVAVATPRALDFIMASIVLFAVLVMSTGFDIPRNKGTQFVAGVTSGVMSYVSTIGGPALALIYRDVSGDTLRASLAIVFSVGLFITLGTRVATGQISWTDVHVAVCLLPAIGAGLFFSRFLMGRVEGRPLRAAILVVASFAGVGLLLRSW